MSTLVAVVVVAAITALIVGLGTAFIDILSLFEKRRDESAAQAPDRSLCWAYTTWTAAIGIILLIAPTNWYGPSWSYFKELPGSGGGFGMGICLTILSVWQAISLSRRASDLTLAILFLLNGFIYWMAGGILAAEGLLGHMGLMEAPFMLVIGAQALALGVKLITGNR